MRKTGDLPFSLSLSVFPSPRSAGPAPPLGRFPRSLLCLLRALGGMREEGTSRAKAPRLLDWSFPQHPPPNTGFWPLFRDCRVWSVLSYSSSWTHGNAKPPQRDRTRVCPPCPLSSPLPSSLVRSYKGSLRQDGAGWIPLPPPGLDLQAIELATENNHYCHAQKDLDSHWDPKKERARRQLYVASAICLVFMIGEVIGKDFCAN